MTHPDFPQPMYEPLRDISQDLILPGIEKVPQNTIGLLETNGRFVESYMVGINHEFAGELLWRRYPTDQCGSYFRQFWDVSEYVPTALDRQQGNQRYEDHYEDNEEARQGLIDKYKYRLDKALALGGARLEEELKDIVLKEYLEERLKDIRRLHEWGDNQLGENDNRPLVADGGEEEGREGQDENLVLVVRGDLFKRYPNAVVYAVDALSEGGPPALVEYDADPHPIYPVFRGSLGADLVFFGFPFTEDDARSSPGHPGKYFVLKERASEARFGLDTSEMSAQRAEGSVSVESWLELNWGHFHLTEPECADRFLDGATTKIVDPDDPNREIDIAATVVGPEGEVWDDSSSAALLAHITLQRPVRLAVHADQMLPIKPVPVAP